MIFSELKSYSSLFYWLFMHEQVPVQFYKEYNYLKFQAQ